jgi:hypothetical protein
VSELFEAPRGRSPLSLVWRWGIVLPVTLLALAGGAADVWTGTLGFWYLLAPSYLLIAVQVWRHFPGDGDAPQTGDDIEGERRRPITIGRVLWSPFLLVLKALMVLGLTFALMVAMWVAIAILTWLKPFWYIYVPTILAIAGLVWLVYRSVVPSKKAVRRRRASARRKSAAKPRKRASGSDVAGP